MILNFVLVFHHHHFRLILALFLQHCSSLQVVFVQPQQIFTKSLFQVQPVLGIAAQLKLTILEKVLQGILVIAQLFI